MAEEHPYTTMGDGGANCPGIHTRGIATMLASKRYGGYFVEATGPITLAPHVPNVVDDTPDGPAVAGQGGK